MKTNLCAILFGAMVPLTAQATTVAVIDSGVDYEHEALAEKMWTNTAETDGDKTDNDGNGKIDDIHGWNFADNDALIIDYALQEKYRPDIEKFLELQLAAIEGTATEGEKLWMKERLTDADFVNSIQTYAGYAHGTHVAGIVARDNPEAKILAAKILSTKTMFQRLKDRVRHSLAAGKDVGFIQEFVFKLGMYGIAIQQSKIFEQIGAYLSANGVSVANGSFGTGMEQARGLVTPILIALIGSEPSAELVDEYASFFVQRMIDQQAKVLAKYPDILFVFAAGNDGSDNDRLPEAPAGVRLDNVITVGASIGNVGLAPFSNYGASRVDLFAPGVGTRSSVPRQNMYLPMSGTSMSAPEVARVAALIKDANPNLKASEIREILMGTIDRKDFLKGRSYSEGVLNDDRALAAAQGSKSTDLRSAIKAAKRAVSDKAPLGKYDSATGDFTYVTPF
ncbi:MAG: hypothetical protein FJ146_02585 [Deltaproteobacteria bacterium]|nr:hypothetical protein [Deltaproteobacteria bacterium]